MLWVLNFKDNPCKSLGLQNGPSLSSPLYHTTGHSGTPSCHSYQPTSLMKGQINEPYLILKTEPVNCDLNIFMTLPVPDSSLY